MRSGELPCRGPSGKPRTPSLQPQQKEGFGEEQSGGGNVGLGGEPEEASVVRAC